MFIKYEIKKKSIMNEIFVFKNRKIFAKSDETFLNIYLLLIRSEKYVKNGFFFVYTMKKLYIYIYIVCNIRTA